MSRRPYHVNNVCSATMELMNLIDESDLSDDKCLEFKYRQSKKGGYSKIKLKKVGKKYSYIQAHRFSYCYHNGVPFEQIKYFVIMHKCDNPCCVNPLHLIAGYPRDNNADRASKNRSAKTRQDLRILTPSDIHIIRSRYSPTRCKINGVTALASEYNVDHNTIYNIVRYKTYTEV